MGRVMRSAKKLAAAFERSVVSVLDAAVAYVEQDLAVVPIPPREKAPRIPNWTALRLRLIELPAHFSNGENIGLILGTPSGGLIDVDLDAREVVAVSDFFLPPTGLVHGRSTMPRSHRWYQVSPSPKYLKLCDPLLEKSDPEKATLIELRQDGHLTVVPPSVHPAGERYEWARIGEPACLDGATLSGAAARVAAAALLARHWPAPGQRHDAALALAGMLLRHWEEEEAARFVEAVATAAGDEEVRARVRDVVSTARRLSASQAATGVPTLARIVGDAVVGKIREWLALDTHKAPAKPETSQRIQFDVPQWPDPPALEAFYGLAGDIVRAIAPHSEADPMALLPQTLAAFGNIVGRGPHFVAEEDEHPLQIWPVLVGITAKSRKGSAWSRIRRICHAADPDWADERIQLGLSSGEGLIWAVHDPIVHTETNPETGEEREVTDDPGVEDKRLLVFESEFSSVLKVASRDGNTLSAILRQTWDRGDLQILTKNSPAKATGTLISVIAHITRDELLRYLTTTEAGNGYANRYLWFAVRRANILPEGGRLDQGEVDNLADRLRAAVAFARGVDEMRRDDEARAIWFKVYPELSEGQPGLLGAVTSRAEAQVMRLACIYACLDRSAVIRKEHLMAALALWEYSEASARFIFGEALGDPLADEIRKALRNNPEGLTRTEIRDIFKRNRKGEEIEKALCVLAQCGLAEPVRDQASEEGRPAERWRRIQPGTTKTTETTKSACEQGSFLS